jgi:hypothetical protein
VIGGLHLPLHPCGTGLGRLAVRGPPHWPWRLVDERDADDVLALVDGCQPVRVALSSHDRTPWTFEKFAATFADRYSTIRAGDQITVAA